jgi:hypothetical protein
MPVDKRFLLCVATTIALIALAGCGGGTSLSFPPPQGTFTNANFTGPFAFSYSGIDGGGFLAVAGSFQADGAGNITSGQEDINSLLASAPLNGSITGTYSVHADGRGTINLVSSTVGNSTLDFVIVANGHAFVTRFDGAATGSGTIDQQSPSSFSNAALAGTYAFTLSGIDPSGAPTAVAGNLTANAAGTITAGVNDSIDNGNVFLNNPLTGSIPVATTGRGVATFNTNTILGTLVFAYYVVDATHLKLIETDPNFLLAGEAFNQTGTFSNASFSGPFAFTAAGADVLNQNPFVSGGIFTSDGAGNITSGTEDFNDAGSTITNATLTGTYSVAANGRGTMTLNTSSGNFGFVIYPSSGGVLLLQTDVQFLTTGTALQQQTTAFSSSTLSGTYGLNFTAAGGGGAELDAIAQFTADGTSKLNGIIDINENLATTFGQPLTGTYTVSANGRTVMPLQTPLGTQNMVVYLVNGNRALFVELDTTLVTAGDIRHQ